MFEIINHLKLAAVGAEAFAHLGNAAFDDGFAELSHIVQMHDARGVKPHQARSSRVRSSVFNYYNFKIYIKNIYLFIPKNFLTLLKI